MKNFLINHYVLEILGDSEIKHLLSICSHEKPNKNEVIFCEEQPSKRFIQLQRTNPIKIETL